MAGSVYMVGMFIGGATVGNICDMFGRKLATILSILVALLGHVGSGFSHNYHVYAFARFLSGIGR